MRTAKLLAYRKLVGASLVDANPGTYWFIARIDPADRADCQGGFKRKQGKHKLLASVTIYSPRRQQSCWTECLHDDDANESVLRTTSCCKRAFFLCAQVEAYNDTWLS